MFSGGGKIVKFDSSAGSGGLRTTKNPGAALARQQIIDYTGIDVLGKASALKLNVQDVAKLEDVRRYMAEQRELLSYAAQKLSTITQDVAKIEETLAEIIGEQLKTRADVDKFIKKALVAGDKYSAAGAKLTQQYHNEQKVIGAELAGELALDNIQTKLKLLRAKAKFNSRQKAAQSGYEAQNQADADAEKQRALQQKAAADRRKMINQGTGSTGGGNFFSRFKSIL